MKCWFEIYICIILFMRELSMTKELVKVFLICSVLYAMILVWVISPWPWHFWLIRNFLKRFVKIHRNFLTIFRQKEIWCHFFSIISRWRFLLYIVSFKLVQPWTRIDNNILIPSQILTLLTCRLKRTIHRRTRIGNLVPIFVFFYGILARTGWR